MRVRQGLESSSATPLQTGYRTTHIGVCSHILEEARDATHVLVEMRTFFQRIRDGLARC